MDAKLGSEFVVCGVLGKVMYCNQGRVPFIKFCIRESGCNIWDSGFQVDNLEMPGLRFRG
jgi:hypothetical protein